MPAYKAAMAVGLAGGAYWFWSTRKEEEKRQAEAVERVGRHGEKAQYGKSFKQDRQEPRFPSPTAASTNAAGGHAGGAKTP